MSDFKISVPIPKPPDSASSYQARIQKQVTSMQSRVAADETLAVILVLPDGGNIFVTWMGYSDPNMLIVDGFDANEHAVRVLVPHVSAHILLATVKRDERKQKPIGFEPLPAQQDT